MESNGLSYSKHHNVPGSMQRYKLEGPFTSRTKLILEVRKLLISSTKS
jgi:hypothetical protein